MKNNIIHKIASLVLGVFLISGFFSACEEENQQEYKAIRMETPEAGASFNLADGAVRFRWQVSGVIPDGYNFILASDPSEADRKVYEMQATAFSREMDAADLDLLLKQWGYEAGTAATIYWRVEAVGGGVDAEPLREVTIRRMEAEAVGIPLGTPSDNAIFDLRSVADIRFSWADNIDISSYAMEFSLTEEGEKLNLDTGAVDLTDIVGNTIDLSAETLQKIIEGSGQGTSVVSLYWKIRSNSKEAPGASASRRIRFIRQDATEVSPVGELKAVPGYKRARLSWKIDDPQTTCIGISWTGGSQTVEVTPSDSEMSVVLDNLPEGEIGFSVISYDAQERASEPVTVTAHIYGDEFARGLENRRIALDKLTREGVTLTIELLMHRYLLYSELGYTNAAGEEAVLRIENDRQTLTLDPATLTLGKSVTLRSFYAPESEVLDPFVPENVPEIYIPVYGLMDKRLHSRINGVACDHGENAAFPVAMMFDGITTDPLNMWHTSGDSHNASNADGSLTDDPILLTLDLGRSAHLSSLVLWGRYGGTPEKPLYDGSLPLVPGASYWAFGSYNARSFEVWGSDVQPADVADEDKWKVDGTWKNSGEWTKLADCEIVRPSGCPATSFGDEDLNLYPEAYPPSAEDFAAAAEGFEFPIAADLPVVRYLRLVIKTNWHYSQRKRVSQGELSFYAFEPEQAE